MKNGLAVFTIGLTCGVISSWMVGCTNHGSYQLGGDAKAQTSGQSQNRATPEASSSFSGSWICDDSQCETDAVVNLGGVPRALTTQSTVHFPKAKPESVCRVQESDTLSVSNQNASQIVGSLSSSQYMVLESPENTHDCQDYYEKLNQSQSSTPSSRPVSMSLDASGLLINGVRYRHAGQQDLQSLVATRDAANSRDASIAGTWNCVDDSCDDMITAISADLSSMDTFETLRDGSGEQSCRIREHSKLAITDPSDPDRLEGSVSTEAPSLVVSASNTPGCDELVKSIGDEPSEHDKITIERDGNQILVVNNQRFLRDQENGS